MSYEDRFPPADPLDRASGQPGTALRGKRVLVTGATGFMGSHLVEALAECAAEVTVLVRYPPRHGLGSLDAVTAPIRSTLRVVRGDLLDLDSVRRAVRGMDYVFHLGGMSEVSLSYQAPLTFVETNVQGTTHVLEACRENAVERFVLASTSLVYAPATAPVKINEEHRLQPGSPYATSKLAAEQVACAYSAVFTIPVTIARCFNVYGPRQAVRRLVPTIIRQALDARPIRLRGSEIVRDFVFVTDAVDALLRLTAASGARGGTFNIGRGEGQSLQSLARIAGDLVGRGLHVDHQPTETEPPWAIADIGALRRLTGWRPAVTMEDGMRRVLEWEQASRLVP